MQKFYLITINSFPTKVFLQEEQAITFGKRMKIQFLEREIKLYSQDITTSGMFIEKMNIEVKLTSINFTNEILKNIETMAGASEFIRLVIKSDTQEEYKKVLLSRLADHIHKKRIQLGIFTSVYNFIVSELQNMSADKSLADQVKY